MHSYQSCTAAVRSVETVPQGVVWRSDYYTIRRFVRARQHDLDRAHVMLVNHIKWRKEVDADGILDNFEYQERDSFLTIYPQGYHKTDKMVRGCCGWAA
jgi:glutamate synthase domain-containing protein 3